MNRLLDGGERLLAAPQVAQAVRLVVERRREVGQEGVGAGLGQPPADRDRLLDRGERLLAAPQVAQAARLVVERRREVGQEGVCLLYTSDAADE